MVDRRVRSRHADRLGVAELHEREIGSFSVDELTEFRGRFGLPIERDLQYRPATIRAIAYGRDGHVRWGTPRSGAE